MAGGGGAWKVAYADFVTAMMAFFMVMWLVNQKPEVKKAIAEHFRDPGGKHMTGTPDSSILKPKDTGAGGRKNRMRSRDNETTQTKMTTEGDRSNVGTVIHFNANNFALSKESKEKLDALLPELVGKPHRVEVRGHAIEDSYGGLQAHLDAWKISYQRSVETMTYLVEHGVAPERIRLSQAGGSEPMFVGNEPDDSQDARVEVFLLNEVFEDKNERTERLISIDKARTSEPPPPTPEELAAKEAAAHGGGH